jgi:CheY-like chemotaxis protein
MKAAAMIQRSSVNDTPPPIRVLVADDSADARLLFRTFLSLLGFQVCTAADGREAVTYAEHFKPDVVFLDLWMPEMDGIEACIRLRQGPCPPPVPIFAVTADARYAESAPDCFDRVLSKPVDLDRAADLVRNHAEFLRRAARKLN